MRSCVPFVNSEADAKILSRFHADAYICRVLAYSLVREIPEGMAKWVDAGFDGFVNKPTSRSDSWLSYMSKLESFSALDSTIRGGRVDKKVLHRFTDSLVATCRRDKPTWFSVPQLPYDGIAAHKRINKAICVYYGASHAKDSGHPRAILPVILSGTCRYARKPERGRLIAAVKSNFEKARAFGLWIVDSSLSDLVVTASSQSRFGHLIEVHDQLRKAVGGRAIIVAGPYWGLNLLCWARNIVDYPAISMGGGYQYHVSGGRMKRGSIRVPLSPLRRTAVVGGLDKWLEDALSILSAKDRAFAEFNELRGKLETLSQDSEGAKKEVAFFYANWVNTLGAIPELGRALALYQDFSNAFVVGKSLCAGSCRGDMRLPSRKRGYASQPYAVAEALMLNCLG